MKGDNYSYDIKAQFEDTKGTGTRNEGAGILGRSCTFEFVKQPPAAPESAPDSSKPAEPPAAKPDEPK
jgi:hypothetical protein